jgi:hypothetical protein
VFVAGVRLTPSGVAMRTTFVLAALVFTGAPVGAQDAVTLKWSLAEGTTFYTKSVTDMDMQINVLGQSIDMKMKVSGVQRLKVLSAKPGATKIEMTMTSMEMSVEGLPGGAGIPGLDAIGDRIKGATLTATLDDKLAVTKLEGYDKFLDKLAGDDAAVRKQMKTQFSEATVGQMFTQVFSFAPDKSVKVGDTWNRTEKMPAAGMEATVKQKYKLDSVTDGVAKIGLTGDVTFKAGQGFPGLPEGVDVSNFEMKAEKFAGTLLFDTKTGRLTENKTDMDLNGSVTISANGQKIEMTMKIKAKQTATVTDKNPMKD